MAPDTERLTLAQVIVLVDDVEGWMTAGQAATLYDAARRCPSNGQIVEIGSFHGRSTIVLACAADPTVDIAAIDPHSGNDRGPQEIDGFSRTTFGVSISKLTPGSKLPPEIVSVNCEPCMAADGEAFAMFGLGQLATSDEKPDSPARL